MDSCHAVVSGAGVIGLSAARLLAKHGYNVQVVDPKQGSPAQGKLGVHIRTAALSPASLNLLENLGLDLADLGQDLNEMVVWESEGTGSITFDAEESSAHHLAFVVEQEMLADHLADLVKQDVELNYGVQITAYDSGTGTLTLSDGQSVSPDLLVIAEGPQSNTCKILEVAMSTKPLQQHALVSVLRAEKEHNGVAIQRFSPTPFALLPMKNQQLLSLIWTLDDDRVEECLSMSDEDFLTTATRESEAHFGALQELDQRITFPLTHQIVEDFNPQPNVLVIGDSAHTVHPLAGQGINLGLEDVRAMQPVLEQKPESLNSPDIWREFNHKRTIRAKSIMRLMESFSAIWKTQRPYLRWLRNVGVRFVDQNQSLKQQLIKEAMGIGPMAEDS